jgi:hypothetical protein
MKLWTCCSVSLICFTRVTGVACSALARSGHTATALPSNVMNRRRLIIRSPRQRGRATYLELH